MNIISFQNIIDGNGIGISVTGMVIVFAALVFIAVFLTILPKALIVLEKIWPEETQQRPDRSVKKSNKKLDIIAAIGYTFYKKK